MSDAPLGFAAEGGTPSAAERSPSSSLERLRTLLYEEGGLMKSLLSDYPSPRIDGSKGPHKSIGMADGSTESLAHTGLMRSAGPASAGPAQLAAAGPRINGRAADYELLIETVYEGYLLHYHAPRVVCPPEADLGVLAGDRLYALGLARLVHLGDIEAVAELADVITLSALAHGGGSPELAEAVWIAGARAVGWGASADHDRAKALVRAGSPGALEAMSALDAV
ncbi:MAG: hypothetical protein WBQ21_08620 [Solirubrobacteraceae bacterium]